MFGFLKQLWQLKREIKVLYLACRDPRVPWPARFLAVGVLAYACSPIDLIPDFIPLLGALDDLILVPLGLWLVTRMIPGEIVAEYRGKLSHQNRRWPASWMAAGIIILIWLVLLVILLRWLWIKFR